MQRQTAEGRTDLPESFLTRFRSERTTPYTSFASSSKVSIALCCGCTCDCGGGGECARGGGSGVRGASSLTATTTPVAELSVLRGVDHGAAPFASAAGSSGFGKTAAETAGRRPPSTAVRGFLARCQSW